MSMKRSSLPRTNPSQENLDYIDKESKRSSLKPDRTKLREAADRFKRFTESEKVQSESESQESK
jgi:hypothetical protein